MRERRSLELLLPLFGDPALCRLAIASALDQNHDDFQLTILDDSYPHFPLADHIAGLGDHRIDYRQNEAVLGAGGNFRRALCVASADWVSFMGADDLLHPDYLRRMAEMVAAFPSADVVQPGVRVIDAGGAPVAGLTDRVKRLLAPAPSSAARPLRGESVTASLLRGNWTYFPSLLWRRSTITSIGFRDYDVVQDLGLLIDVLMGGGSLLLDPAVTFAYRRHRSSLSAVRAHTGARFEEERAFFNDVADELTSLGWSRAARSARLRPSSRLHAALLVPRAFAASEGDVARRLLHHALLP